MSQIEELQSRITAAMERIGTGVSALSAPEDTGEVAELTTRLDEEKLANAQLEERLTTLKSKQTDELAKLNAEMDNLNSRQTAQSEAMAKLDMDVQRLRQANDQLRDSNAALRQANEEGVGEPHLINKAMLAELEALRATRATDAAEVGAVLAKLGPLLAGAENLTEGEEA